MKRILPVVIERMSVLEELKEALQEGEYDYLFNRPTISKEYLPWKDDTLEEARTHLIKLDELLSTMPELTNAMTVKNAVWQYAVENGKGSVLWPMRYALTGRTTSPDPFSIAAALGKEETLQRLRAAASL